MAAYLIVYPHANFLGLFQLPLSLQPLFYTLLQALLADLTENIHPPSSGEVVPGVSIHGRDFVKCILGKFKV